MPTYEYECKTCGHRFEVFQSMSEAPIKKCPECGKAVRRLVSGGVGVIFKGSGFYVTDKDKSSVPKGGSASKKDTCPKGDGCPKGDTCPKSDTASKGGAASGDSAPKGESKGKAKPAA